MRIDFNRIEIHNFMSFSDEVFDYAEHKGMNLVCGKNNDIPGAKNGTGKSTLFSALIFCLFGETQNKIKNNNIHNRYTDAKDVRVVVYFSKDGLKYKVSTGFNKYCAAYCNLSKFEDDKEIDLTKSSIIETRKMLEREILHCDISMFLRTIMLSSDQTYNFFRLRKGEKKEFIEKLFDISVFGDMYNAIHRDVLDLDKQILTCQNKLMMLNKTNDQYVNCIAEYNKAKSKKIADINVTLLELNSKYDNLKDKKITINEAEVRKYEDLVDKINDAKTRLDKFLHTVENTLSKIDISIHKLNQSKDHKQNAISKYSEILSKLCTDCQKKFSDYYNIGQYSADIADIQSKISQLTAEKNENLAKIDDCNDKIEKLDNKLHIAEKKIADLTDENVKTNNELTAYKSRIDHLNMQLNEAMNECNPYESLFEKNKTDIDVETMQLNELTDKYKYLKYSETIVSQDTLRRFIIKDLVGLLNNKIKTYLTKLGAKYTVEFDADMDYEFITDGGTCEYDNFSAGERQRIMIATCFAFRDFMAIRNSFSSNILILDEFIDSNIDALAIEGVIKILKDFITMYNQNIYVVSHRKEIDNSIFDNIIQVQKTNNISKIAILDSNCS